MDDDYDEPKYTPKPNYNWKEITPDFFEAVQDLQIGKSRRK